MTDKTQFTVLVPTRERADTLYYALRTLTQQRYENMTIIVSDNASTDRTESVVREVADSRVRYVNTGTRVSMSQNFEFALSHVRDGWITFIGDDDGLLPGALDRVDSAIRETGCTAVTSGWCYYRWPQDGLPRPFLSVPLGRGYQVRRSQLWLNRLLNAEAQYPELPWLYTGGFAAMDLVRKALDERGRFFRSRIPDIYSAIALASVTAEYAAMRAPVAVSGVSVHSTGHSQLTGHNRLPGEKFATEENLPMHPVLGSIWPPWSMSLFIYESYLQAFDLHRDVFRISMSDQLALALTEHVGTGRAELEGYVRHVAEHNGIDFAYVSRLARKRSFVRWLRRKKGILTLTSNRLVDGAYGAQNVLEASWVANAVFKERTEGHFWRTREISRRICARLKNVQKTG
jgi:glycosyltransferase involved in cell wall biosynthesis